MKLVPIALVVLTLAPAAAVRADDTRVTAVLANPERYTDFRSSCVARPADARALAGEIEAFLRTEAAPLLPEDTRLEITVVNVDMAGDIESWRGPGRCDLRVMKDVYPPRIELRFRLTDADGRETRAGRRLLQDSNYLADAESGGLDRLRHEKALLRDWLRRELREGTGS